MDSCFLVKVLAEIKNDGAKLVGRQDHYVIVIVWLGKMRMVKFFSLSIDKAGHTAEAAAKLIELSGGTVAGFIFIINLFDLPGNDLLKNKSYFTESLIEFPGH